MALSVSPVYQGRSRITACARRDILPYGVRTFLPGSLTAIRSDQSLHGIVTKPKLRQEYRQYKIRPQNEQHTMLWCFFTFWITWGGNFMWQPPQAVWSTGTMA